MPLILLGVNLIAGSLAAGVVYGYAGNQISLRDQLTRAMRNLNDERTTVAQDLAYLQANQTSYDMLLERGLLAEPDRLAAARLLEQLRVRRGLNGIRYSFSPQPEAPLGPGRLARMTLLSTDVAIDMTGITDLDLLAFARAVASDFPGNVRVVGFSLQRRAEADPDVLARLRAGERVDLVDGRLQFEWRALRWEGAAPLPASTEPRQAGGHVMSPRRLLAAALPLLTTAGTAPLAAEPAGETPSAPAAARAEPHKAARQLVPVLEPGARPDRGRPGRRAARGPARRPVGSGSTGSTGRQSPPRSDPLSRPGRLADLAERPELHAPGPSACDRDP